MDKHASFKPPKNINDLTSSLSSVISNKKVLILIDAANLFFSTSITKIYIDFHQMADWFKKKCDLVDINYYTAFDPEDVKQKAFLDDLENNGYKLIRKPIKVYSSMIKGNMDIELAVDAMNRKKDYDTLVLFSGDGDFTYLIQDLETKGKKIIVIGTGGFTSYELHQQAHNYFFLNRISGIWQKPRKAKTKISKNDSSDNNPQVFID